MPMHLNEQMKFDFSPCRQIMSASIVCMSCRNPYDTELQQWETCIHMSNTLGSLTWSTANWGLHRRWALGRLRGLFRNLGCGKRLGSGLARDDGKRLWKTMPLPSHASPLLHLCNLKMNVKNLCSLLCIARCALTQRQEVWQSSVLAIYPAHQLAFFFSALSLDATDTASACAVKF